MKSILKILAATVLALFLALLTPFTLAASLWFLFAPVAAVWLYAWAGAIPSLAFSAVTVALCYLTGGGMFAGMSVIALVLPALIAIAAIKARKSYVVCMRISVVAQTGAILIALAFAWFMLRANLVDSLLAYFAERLKQFPSAMTDSLFLLYGQGGAFPQSGIDFAKGYLEDAERIRAIDLYVSAVADGLKITLPALILTSGITTGILNVAVPVWIWSRRGDELAVRRVPMSDWRAPKNAAIGLPVCLAIAYILNRTGYPGGDSVYTAVYNIFLLLLELQALGALSRALKRRGMSRGGRVAMLILGITLARYATILIGAYSLYFGSQGVLSTAIRKRLKKHDKEE